ncbi:MAG: glutathione binding-like protein, partial [Pseudomonadota bacterium]
MLWLTDHFNSELGRGTDHPARGAYLSWLFYYGNVIEPILYLTYLDIAGSDMIKEWCRDQATMFKTLETSLEQHDFLVDDVFSAADLLVSAPFQWFPDILPENGPIRSW